MLLTTLEVVAVSISVLIAAPISPDGASHWQFLEEEFAVEPLR